MLYEPGGHYTDEIDVDLWNAEEVTAIGDARRSWLAPSGRLIVEGEGGMGKTFLRDAFRPMVLGEARLGQAYLLDAAALSTCAVLGPVVSSTHAAGGIITAAEWDRAVVENPPHLFGAVDPEWRCEYCGGSSIRKNLRDGHECAGCAHPV